MSSGNTGDAHGNPNNPTNEESPRRRRAGANVPLASPRGRGSPSTPRPTRPVMGVPGQSAFSPFPNPSQPHSGPGGSGGLGSARGPTVHGAHAVLVGGGGDGGVAAPGALRIVGSPAARKRVWEAAAGSSAAAGGNQPGEGAGNIVNCSVCGKAFLSVKALFGHMRSHPDRGWKGAHPPPMFRVEEEFADLPGLNQPKAPPGDDAQEGGDEGEEGAREGEEEAGDPRNYRVPDLNNPPPPDSK